MIILINKRFPTIIVKDSNDFSKDIPKGTSLWLTNTNEVTYTDKDENVICSLDVWVKASNTKLYDIDVYIKFGAWCNRYGWYASTENYTLNLFKI